MKSILLALILFSAPLSAGVPSYFSQQVSLKTGRVEKPLAVIYGNEVYGYFASNDWTFEKSEIQLSLFPPGYKYPIEFFARERNGSVTRLGKRSFANKQSKLVRILQAARGEGRLTVPYVLLTADLRGAEDVSDLQIPVVYLLNRLGEVVWAYEAPPGSLNGTNFLMVKKSAAGHYGVLAEAFTEINAQGKVIREVPLTSSEGDYPAHYDFLWLNDRLVSFSLKPRFYYDWSDWFPFIKMVSTDEVRSWDLNTRESRMEWDFYQWIQPQRDPNFRALFKQDLEIYADYVHPSSIAASEKGEYLMSLRELNSILLWDPKSQKVKWSVGANASDTYHPENAALFAAQHSVTFVGPQNLLVFDNGTKKSRIIEIELKDGDRSARLVKSFSPKKDLHITTQGSARLYSATQGILGYFPRPIKGKSKEYIIEFDRKSGETRAQFEMQGNESGPLVWGRMDLTESIGGETYLGMTLANQRPNDGGSDKPKRLSTKPQQKAVAQAR